MDPDIYLGPKHGAFPKYRPPDLGKIVFFFLLFFPVFFFPFVCSASYCAPPNCPGMDGKKRRKYFARNAQKSGELHNKMGINKKVDVRIIFISPQSSGPWSSFKRQTKLAGTVSHFYFLLPRTCIRRKKN